MQWCRSKGSYLYGDVIAKHPWVIVTATTDDNPNNTLGTDAAGELHRITWTAVVNLQRQEQSVRSLKVSIHWRSTSSARSFTHTDALDR
jgi:hypothetical protein